MIDVFQNLRDLPLICTWMGNHVDSLNEILRHHLSVCYACLPFSDRQPVHLFAVPLAQSLNIDGFCMLTPVPTLFIDAGRVVPDGWLAIVAHELAHALSNSPGHHPLFASILAVLCHNLGFPSPIGVSEDALQRLPAYQSTIDPLALWRGETLCPKAGFLAD